jgi:hypothetical protein
VTQQPAREQGGATRGGGVDMKENKRGCRDKRQEEDMEVTDAMATMEVDTVGIGMVRKGGRMRTMRPDRGLLGTARVGGIRLWP